MKRRSSIRRWIAISGLCLFIIWLGIGIAASREHAGWIDAVSGSTRRQTIWMIGYEGPARMRQSPLDHAYRRLQLGWKPDWRKIKGDGINFFTGSRVRSHGMAPPIYALLSPQLQSWYVASASDDEIRRLFETMTTGSIEEQKAAVEAAAERGLDHMARH